MAYRDKAKKRKTELAYIQKCRKSAIEHLGGKCHVCGSVENIRISSLIPKKRGDDLVRRRDPSTLSGQITIYCEPCRKLKDAKKRMTMIRHGTIAGYGLGCRCRKCYGIKQITSSKRIRASIRLRCK